CRVPAEPIPGVAACTAEQVPNTPCLPPGARCDPRDCEKLLVCTSDDPTHGDECPISRRDYKEDIAYLTDADVRRLHDDLMRFRLASYRYRATSKHEAHLGFIIDDVEPSPSVDATGERVDLYGYASMAVAALQTQDRAIEALKKEVETLRREI